MFVVVVVQDLFFVFEKNVHVGFQVGFVLFVFVFVSFFLFFSFVQERQKFVDDSDDDDKSCTYSTMRSAREGR